MTAVTAVTAGTLVLSACAQEPGGGDGGGDGDGDGGDEQVDLRFSWWGADLRHQLTQEAIAAFEAEHPDITISPEFRDWGGYWDRLSTTAAAGDMPDIVQMDEKYLRTYADQGTLLDLYTLDELGTENIDPTVLSSGEVDGSLYALVTAVNTFSVIGNSALLDEAGVSAPDDVDWTWEDLAAAAQQVTENTGDGVYGIQYLGNGDSMLQIWARQHGESLWTPEGELGVSQETLQAWWQYILDVTESGAASPASLAQEQINGGQELSGTSTNQAGFGLWWSNQYRALSESSGEELLLLRPPIHTEAEDRGNYNKPSMFWSIAADTEHPEEAAMFVDFMVNSTEAGEILLVERGIPSNLEVREQIADQLTEEDQEVVAFLDEVSDEVGEAPPLTPAGASNIEPVIQRITFAVLFGDITPAEGAEQFIAEAEEMIAG